MDQFSVCISWLALEKLCLTIWELDYRLFWHGQFCGHFVTGKSTNLKISSLYVNKYEFPWGRGQLFGCGKLAFNKSEAPNFKVWNNFQLPFWLLLMNNRTSKNEYHKEVRAHLWGTFSIVKEKNLISGLFINIKKWRRKAQNRNWYLAFVFSKLYSFSLFLCSSNPLKMPST